MTAILDQKRPSPVAVGAMIPHILATTLIIA
jgi:hypothetical protein